MTAGRLYALAGLLATAVPAIAQPSAADLLEKARAALDRNHEQEPHWNWTTIQNHTLTDRAGHTLRRLPDVTVESVIRQDGRRCNAVLSWGDGVAPYKLNEDADVRCSGQDPVEPPLRVESLLRSLKVKLVDSYTIAIRHDKARVHDPRPEVRCTASVEGTVRLDPATFFPVHLEGTLVDTGCEGETWAELHYGGDPVKMMSHRGLLKGTSFRLEFALQPDKYGHPANSYWISTGQHWNRPFTEAAGVVYNNRRFEVNLKNASWVTDSRTTAQEFGVQSLTRFDTVPK
ncbi:MAG: hypothetical protein P4L56_12770 [Candidatus Sulfopaludibacter sp.]|nr:hypothetical protein [Candidatus Sulfopaludibacter sp.]